jgi:hypothetical protein
MRRRAPQGRSFGFACLLTLQVVGLACGEAREGSEQNVLHETADRANQAPTIESIALEPASPTPGGAVRVIVEVNDPDGDPVKMSYEWKLDGRPVGNGTAKLMLHEAERGDDLEVVVVASDGRDDSEPESKSVRIANQPPTVQRLRVAPSNTVTAGEIIEASAEARDPEGDPLEFVYTWELNGREVGGDPGAEFDTSGLTTGDVLRVEVRASDGESLSEPFHSPDIRITNRPPRVVSRPGASSSGGGFAYTVVAEDPDGDTPLRFELEDAPEGMQIGAHDGEIHWTPRPDQAGRHQIRVVVDDLRGGRVSHVFDVDVGGAAAPPAAVEP